MLRATGACCLMPSDTRVMPPKIQPRLLRCRSLARLGRPSQVRASRTSSYPLTFEKALKSTHTILRRADFSPAIDQIVQLGPILGLVPGKRHRLFILELGDRGKLGNQP